MTGLLSRILCVWVIEACPRYRIVMAIVASTAIITINVISNTHQNISMKGLDNQMWNGFFFFFSRFVS